MAKKKNRTDPGADIPKAAEPTPVRPLDASTRGYWDADWLLTLMHNPAREVPPSDYLRDAFRDMASASVPGQAAYLEGWDERVQEFEDEQREGGDE